MGGNRQAGASFESSSSGLNIYTDASDDALLKKTESNMTAGTLEAELTVKNAASAQGPVSNVLPVLEGSEEVEPRAADGFAPATSFHRRSSYDEISLLPDQLLGVDPEGPDCGLTEDEILIREYSKLENQSFRGVGGSFSRRTPGEIRTAVLEWMYEEKDGDVCPYLSLGNADILEDLIQVFVSVILHGKSDFIRSHVWRFLLQASVNSVHFAFLVICNLNASCAAERPVVDDSVNDGYRSKHTNTLSAIEDVMNKLESGSLPRIEKLQEIEGKENPIATELRSITEGIMSELSKIHDHQILTNIDLNLRGRNSRQNIELLIRKVRRALANECTTSAEDTLRDLDGKLGFIKTLTSLGEWLMRSVPREERAQVLQEKLATLAVALPLGAYIPTAVAGGATQKHRVLRLVLDEVIVFNTAHKCPFLLVTEVEPILGASDGSATEGNARDRINQPHNLALEALEMVGTKEFWKNPAKEIKSFRQRAHNEHIVDAEWDDETADSDEDTEGHSIVSSYADGKDASIANEANFSKLEMEQWEDMQERCRKASPFGHRPNWQLASMFVKVGDDLRQQHLGILFVSTFQKIFLEEGLPVWLSPYKVIPTGPNCGLLEPARNSDSIARIKERGGYEGIDEYFLDKFGPKNSRRYNRAVQNFMKSLAGYSIVAYLIRLSDRHNGNILIDTEGHLLHIDFGFLLIPHGIERSPFKLSPDMVEILGGPYSLTFQKFRRLMEKAYIAANKHRREIVLLAELLSNDEGSSECLQGGRRWVIDELHERLSPGLSTRKLRVHINDIIDRSMYNYTTRFYDRYQRCCNGIF